MSRTGKDGMHESVGAEGGRRGRGERAGLDQELIVATAAEFGLAEISVQAVADRLGVDRKAVSHHVNGREGLLRLVARRRFLASIASVDPDIGAGWRAVCHAYVTGVAAATATLGEFAPYGDAPDLYAAERTDAVLGALHAAGFDDEHALRLVVALTRLALSWGRERADLASGGGRPRADHARELVVAHGRERLPHLARILDARIDTYDERQLEFETQIILRGAAKPTEAGPAD